MSRRRPVIALLAMFVMFVCVVSGFAGAARDTDGASASDVAPGPFGKYDPPITVEFINYWSSTELETISSSLTSATGETPEDNRWTRLFSDELGINVEYKWYADTEQGGQKLRLAMASGDLPEFITLPSRVDLQQSLVNLKQLAEGGLIADMTDAWEEYASDDTRDITGADGPAIFDAVKYNGRMMAIPGPRAGLDTYSYMWIRSDWLDNLGLDPPTSTEDLLNIAYEFTHSDPDGNGIDDTYGLQLDKDLWFRLEGFFWAFGAYPDAWLKDGEGGLMYGAVQPEMKEALAALQAMYNDGQLDPEFGVKDATKANEMLAAGRVGIVFGGHWESVNLSRDWENNPNADWTSFPNPGPGGSIPMGEIELGIHNLYSARDDAAHPEALVKMFNLYFEKLYGETGDYEHWGNDEMDGIWWIGPISGFHPWVNITPYEEMQQVYAGTMRAEDLKGVSLDYYNNTENNPSATAAWFWAKMFKGDQTPFAHILNVLDEGLIFGDHFAAAPTNTMVDRWGTLEELKNSTVTRIIVGDLDADTGFDEYVQSWMNLGGSAITEEASAWFASN